MGALADHLPVVAAAAGAYSLVVTRGGAVFSCGNGRAEWHRLHFDVTSAAHHDAVAAYLEAEAELRPPPAASGSKAGAAPAPATSAAAAAAELSAAGFSVLHYAVAAPPPSSSSEQSSDAPLGWALQKRGKRGQPAREPAQAAASVAAPRFGSSFGQSAVIRQVRRSRRREQMLRGVRCTPSHTHPHPLPPAR